MMDEIGRAPASQDALFTALARWRAELGGDRVQTDSQSLDRYSMSTASRATRPSAVLWPQSTDEIARIVRIGAEFRIALYPISTGKNWGYGDACAPSDGQVIVDLSRMNRIIEVDPVLAYAVIEPGVTQQQLAQYLLEQDIALQMDCTGAGPDTSLVGNILERGFGHSPYGDRFRHIAGMQIVLASGEVLDTGFGHFPCAKATYLFPYGVGPVLDGLFTQSNLGVITRLGIWLMPRAACINHFICTVDRHEQIAPVVDAMRPLRLDGTLRSVVHIGNDLRLISGGRVYPRELAQGQVPLPDALRAELRAQAGVGAWTVSGALYGDTRQVAAARHALRRALRPTGARTIFLSEAKLEIGAWLARLLGNSRIGRQLDAKVRTGRALFAMNRGQPDGRFLAGAYWRRRGGLPPDFPQNADPARDNCGLLWVSPILPLRGADLLHVYALVQPWFQRYGFDLFATFSMINERSLGGVITVAYDKDDPGEVERARTCYRALFELLMKEGYIPYRVGNQSMGQLNPADDVFWRTVQQIKLALDPLGIIAPGRYSPAPLADRGGSNSG